MESGPEFLIALERLQEFLDLDPMATGALHTKQAAKDEKQQQQQQEQEQEQEQEKKAKRKQPRPHTEAAAMLNGSGGAHTSSQPPARASVHVDAASISWEQRESAFRLSNVQLHAGTPSLIAITGPVGAGKSTLLSALVGEAACSPPARVSGSVAYAPQQPWIFSGTLRSNVLFSSAFDAAHYATAVDACALRRDIELLPHGEDTEIGEKGINLSGGQKARVSLARCVYARADVVLLDDPLAAVDADVAEHLFTQAIKPMSRERIVVLATHHPHFAAQADVVLVVGDGKVEAVTPDAYVQRFSGGAAGHAVVATRKGDSNSNGSRVTGDVAQAKGSVAEENIVDEDDETQGKSENKDGAREEQGQQGNGTTKIVSSASTAAPKTAVAKATQNGNGSSSKLGACGYV